MNMANMAEISTNAESFKNFHRSLCERFGYTHDELYWWRDLVSLEEHIAKVMHDPSAPHVQAIRLERDEADRRAGAAERELANERKSAETSASWVSKAKAQWGVNDNTSFDVVWEQAMAMKSNQKTVTSLATAAQEMTAAVGPFVTLLKNAANAENGLLPAYGSIDAVIAVRDLRKLADADEKLQLSTVKCI